MSKILLIFCLIIQNVTPKLPGKTDTLILSRDNPKLLTHEYFQELEDPEEELTIKDIISNNGFHHISQRLPVLHYSKSTTWLKFILKNNTGQPYIPIAINASVIDEFDMYYADSVHHKVIHKPSATRLFYDQSPIRQNEPLINCELPDGASQLIYLRIKSHASSVVPIRLSSLAAYLKNTDDQNIFISGFLAVMLAMALYNLMLFIIVRDLSYLYYAFYILFLGLSQAFLRGYILPALTHNIVIANSYIIPLNRFLLGLSMLLFVQNFLQLRQNLKNNHRYYYLLYVLYSLPVFAVIFGKTTAAYNLLTFASFFTSSTLLCMGLILYLRGFKPAKFFMIGWGFFLLSVIITIVKNKGLLPYNEVTNNLVLYSSVIELILFSAALADKINFYRQENDKTQEFALTIARANEQFITQQNIELENQVKARTEQLLTTNHSLLGTIEDLKSTQKKLVNTEKMASLGVLTAGVAHEINNPINFVSSSINPLRVDLEEIFILLNKYQEAENNAANEEVLSEAITYRKKIDVNFLKEEIFSLFNGIEEGAARTAEIVQSLRSFSRTDELILKPMDLNKAILNTLIILRSTIPYTIEIKPLLDKLEPIICYPGKINQVLMNLINNGIQAINAKTEHINESILISTTDHSDYVSIEITDSGTGMTDEVKQRIFEPFFTTKIVGEGTGLGLSIVFGIIEQHHGTIEVQSEYGKGSTFRVTLPKNLEEILKA